MMRWRQALGILGDGKMLCHNESLRCHFSLIFSSSLMMPPLGVGWFLIDTCKFSTFRVLGFNFKFLANSITFYFFFIRGNTIERKCYVSWWLRLFCFCFMNTYFLHLRLSFCVWCPYETSNFGKRRLSRIW